MALLLILILAVGTVIVMLENEDDAEADNLSVPSADTNAVDETVKDSSGYGVIFPIAGLFAVAYFILKQKA